jgi:alpha-ribazole phosphatase/probable phosphoglycerate mutase
MPRETVTTLDLMRHGEPVGGRRYRGQTDDPLSEKGWVQMRDAVGNHCPWQAVISSSLARCADFARELAERHQLPLEIDARLIELGFGAWEGRTPDELTAADPETLNRFRRDPEVHAPQGAELLTAFRERIISAWDSLLVRYGGEHVLVVAHAGVIRMVVAQVLNVPLQHLFRMQVPDAGITRIRVEKHDGQLFPQLLFHGGNL